MNPEIRFLLSPAVWIMVIITTTEMLWRWSQLAVAIAILAAEFITRTVVSLFFKIIPISYIFKFFSVPNMLQRFSEEEMNMERDTVALVTSKGYRVEEHFTITPDGFVLGLHRVPYGREECVPNGAEKSNESPRAHRQPQSQEQQHLQRKKVVLIMHGMMQSSEAFVARRHAEDSLPLVLADAGYDVWLGNNRGNKYSYKHTRYTPESEEFWNWSLDEMIRYDLPSIIDYVLRSTGAETLTLVGFSQGTAQSWAALSSFPEVAAKVNLFVALAPVATVKGFNSPIVDALARSRPDFIFLLFGKKQILPITLFWRKRLSHVNFSRLIDASVNFLFGWTADCIDPSEKPLVYSYIYSYSSVKNAVHWFQIIQSDRFQMFNDAGFQNSYSYSPYTVPCYTPARVGCKVACFYGGRDNLPNSAALIEQLPSKILVHAQKVERYEHLDFMWASDVRKTIYPNILRLMQEHSKF